VHFLNPDRLHRGLQAVERVIAIVEQISRRLVPRKCLAKLLGRPRCRRMRGDRDVQDATSIVARSTRTNKSRYVAVGTTKKSAATIWPM
jgi:hypothetical protein